ncbi:MAG: GNAT family N-acetyltransferase [Oscillospiraceae bacterium]|nr:GNAT family N-acetyltransferase [Oscillospiraceae bacterium]
MADISIEPLYRIFDECFPEISITLSAFETMLSHKSSFLITERLNDEIIGFSAVRDNSVILICVAPGHQYHGIGTKLLHDSETFISKSGYKSVILGRDPSCFFMGAVIDNFSHRFFMKHGYYALNGCLCMWADLSTASFSKVSESLLSGDIVRFELDNFDDTDLEYTVNAVEPKWLRLYRAPGHIITARTDDHIVGFSCISLYTPTLLSSSDGLSGSIDYVGVLPEYRNRGIGRRLIENSMRFQKESGCESAFIRYTSLDEWYRKCGFEEFIWYWLGEKQI